MAVYSQNQHRADSLKQVLNTGNLSEEEAMEVLLKVTVNEPEPIEAIRYARLLLKNAEASNSQLMQAKAYEEIGANERILGNNIRSTEASLTALNIFSELGLEDSKATILAQLGNNAVTDEDYSQAISYFKQALLTYEASQQGIYMALTRLNLGEAFRLNGQLDSAMSYFKSALSINDSIQHPIIASYTLGNLGMTYNTLGQLEDARSALSTAIKQVRGLGDPYTLSVYRADLALVDQKEQKWQAAEIGFKEALGIAQENALKEQIRDISEMMVTYYKLQADFENALVYQELFQVYQDSLVNKENVQELERVKANYEISQRDVEIELLNDRDQRRRQQTFAAIAAMVVFLGLSLLLYRSNRSKQQANQVLAIQKEEIHNRDEEKALLLKELNHRVKNNLQMISSLLNLQGNELKGHPAEAAIAAGKFRVDALALIHQKLYREDIHTTIALKDYLEELILNLCFSFADRIKPDLDIEALDVNIDQAIPLALIVNEWVTNALKYAYEGINTPELVVRLGQNPGQLKLQVIDNGIGMSEMPPENHSSFGLKLVYSLAKQLKAEINYVNDQGSEWTLTIPTA
ncbi:MAG: histidine kinase dimerization/phosphoacceptor domain -containing protein [Cytophagales bacterium]|nr:histidine kinase dimerization/phosphoacceptor domain -containing protein [Cytophagales bacterium]